MTIRWREGFESAGILSSINSISSLDKDGNVSYSNGFAFHEYLAVLEEMLDFTEIENEYVKRDIIRKTLSNLVKRNKAITNKSFISGIIRENNSHNKKPLIPYYMVGEISIRSICKMRIKKLNNSTIKINSGIKNNFYNERKRILDRFEYNINGTPPKWYQFVIVRSLARTIHEGFDDSLKSLNIIRSIWNLYFNRSLHIRSSSGIRKPINKILLGPVNTLHLNNGDAATEVYSYEPNYYCPVDAVNINNKINSMYKFEGNVRRLLKRSKYKVDLEESIMQYGLALDEPNWDISFLRLWNVLELLTGTGEKEGYNTTVRRASFLFKDPHYVMQKLNALRAYRNKSIHTGYSKDNIETYVYLLKGIVEILIEFHLGNKFGFCSISEAADFMSATTDKDYLRKKIKKYENVLSYIR